MMKKKNIISLVLILCLCFALTVPAFATDEISIADDEIDATGEISIVEASEVEQNLRSAVSDADMFVMTKSQSIPLYLEDNISSEQIDKSEVQALLIEAENKSEDIEDYNLYVIEDDLTYFYGDVDDEISISVFETHTDEGDGISPLINIGESSKEFPNGIGCKAYTENSSKTKFQATFYTDNINYAGSAPNNSSDKSKIINLYNYIGNVTANNITTDLGVQYSAANGGWQPYFCHNGNPQIASTVSGSGLYYKGTSNYPTTIAIDRNAIYNGRNGFKLTVSGRTMTNSNGQTVMFGGQALSTSFTPKYKIVSTIASTDINNIKAGAGFKTYWTNIKIDGTTVSNYPDAYYYNGSIAKLTSTGATFTLSRK